MSGGRPAPRWGLLFAAYLLASLTAGAVMALVEYFPMLLTLTTQIERSSSIQNILGSIVAYSLMAGLTGLLPALVIGLGLWWFRVDSLGAYVLAGAGVAALLIVSGFGEISLAPAGPAAGFVFRVIMRLFRRRGPAGSAGIAE